MEAFRLAWQRWHVALAIRDGRWRSIDEINGLVGFDAEPCLRDEKRGSTNFQRNGRRWKMKPEAIRALEASETFEPKRKPIRKPKRPKGNLLKKTKQKVMFR